MPLVDRVTLLAVLLLVPIFSYASSHCESEETTYFNCAVENSNKVISVCGSDGKKRYLQYRFGKIGDIEFEFPKKRDGSISKFYWEVQKEAYGVFSNLSFKNYSYYYDVSHNINFNHRYADDEFFVEVSRSKSQYRPSIASFHCAQFPEGRFGDLANIVQKKQRELRGDR